MTGALGEKLTRFPDGRTQRETDSTALIKGGKAARLAAYFIFKQADHVAYWHIASFRYDAEIGRYRGIADIDQAAPIKLDL